MKTDRPHARQTAYQLLMGSTPNQVTPDTADLWNSGKVESDQSVHVEYNGVPLVSRQRVYWRVIIWDETGTAYESESAWFEMGLLAAEDWSADWIGTDV
ncbi:MAG: alpha-L-rhamnosidase, partial [Anaerolineae bacterium]|nr:alpha-L-rhamnosidase [Anaerolineae bacterium]